VGEREHAREREREEDTARARDRKRVLGREKVRELKR